MKNVSDNILREFIEACRSVADRDLVRCSSGNMSFRLDQNRFLTTCTRSWLERFSANEVSVCNLDDSSVLEGPKPTVEIGFHAGILKTRSDVNVVLHFQTPCATALACRKDADKINYNVIPEIPFYIGPIGRVPYLLPGSSELAKAVTDTALNHDLVIMDNHGIVTVAPDYDHAIQNAEFFELACKIITLNNNSTNPIPEGGIEHLLKLRQNAQRGV